MRGRAGAPSGTLTATREGEQAQTYANHFIAVHLGEIGGNIYSQVSALSLANPKDAKLAGEVQTLFRGETLGGCC